MSHLDLAHTLPLSQLTMVRSEAFCLPSSHLHTGQLVLLSKLTPGTPDTALLLTSKTCSTCVLVHEDWRWSYFACERSSLCLLGDRVNNLGGLLWLIAGEQPFFFAWASPVPGLGFTSGSWLRIFSGVARPTCGARLGCSKRRIAARVLDWGHFGILL